MYQLKVFHYLLGMIGDLGQPWTKQGCSGVSGDLGFWKRAWGFVVCLCLVLSHSCPCRYCGKEQFSLSQTEL